MKNIRAFITTSLLGLALLSSSALGQTKPTPTPTPKKDDAAAQPATPAGAVRAGDYEIISSIELGVRGASVDGNADKYRSDLNYQPGFRLFDSSFFVRAAEGKGSLFDTLLVNSSGWNADPSGSLRVNIEQSHWYRFDANFRRNAYDNRLLNLALGEHISQTKHKFGDFDLRLLPHNRRAKFNLGYSLDRNSGTGTTTYDLRNDEYRVGENVKTRANEYRAGGEFRVGSLDLGFLQGVRAYKDDSTFFSGFTPGNNATNTAVLTSLFRNDPTRARIWFSRASVHTLIDKKVDITARYTYTKSRSRFGLAETSAGVNSSSQTFNPDRIAFSGESVRPNHLADFGITWLATDRLRISETFRYNTFSNNGDFVYNELLTLFRANGTLVSSAVTSFPIDRTLDYRRYYNQLEGDYQVGPRFSFHFGHRYTHRHIDELKLGNSSGSLGAAFREDETFDLNSNSFFGGFKAKPLKMWNVYFDAERGDANDVFTRVDNFRTINFRVRNRIQPTPKLGVNLSFISRDNTNPGETVVDNTLIGPLKATNFDVRINSRIFSGSVDWAPAARYSFSAGYTHNNLKSDAAILFFAGLPTPNPAQAGRSQYFMRDNFFYASANVELFKRVSAFAAYRAHRDTAQGDRVSIPAQGLFIGGIPLNFQTPEVRLIFKINHRLDWNVGYQYFDYNERLTNSQDYRAHLPYTSLRIYFGGGGDR
ncbi:MAG: hypothetical protein QOF61_161 [Acidobacteriota bacterium]|nr:hypothetical protein [Acidobacteriota bacterium]